MDEYIESRSDVLGMFDAYTTFHPKDGFEVWDSNRHDTDGLKEHDAKSLVVAVLHGGN